MDGWMNGWVDEWMNGWMDGWMEGWIHNYRVDSNFMLKDETRQSLRSSKNNCCFFSVHPRNKEMSSEINLNLRKTVVDG